MIESYCIVYNNWSIYESTRHPNKNTCNTRTDMCEHVHNVFGALVHGYKRIIESKYQNLHVYLKEI